MELCEGEGKVLTLNNHIYMINLSKNYIEWEIKNKLK